MLEIKNRIVLMSIKPKYARAIFEGEKTVEFRRVFPEEIQGSILVYSSSPEKRLIGSFRIKNVKKAAPETLWKLFHNRGGITKKEFQQYFDGCSNGTAIEIFKTELYPEPKSLEDVFGFIRPPQNYRYVPGT